MATPGASPVPPPPATKHTFDASPERDPPAAAAASQASPAEKFVDQVVMDYVALARDVPLNGKTALVTGITGQDGSYLAELLLSKGYRVVGLLRRSSSFNTGRIEHLYVDSHEGGGAAARFSLVYGDLSDTGSVVEVISRVRPDEIYNLGAQSHVAVSFAMPEYTLNVDGVGTLRLLSAVRAAGLEKSCRFYQASTSELYGKVAEVPQRETTPFHPRSPYAVAKLAAFWSVINFREAYGMHCSNGILFNHESPRRGPTFVTRKITRAVARIKRGLQKTLFLGNLDARRDWGHAKDFVEGMWRILQLDAPTDIVLATGEMHSVREFCELAFAEAGMRLEWRGERGSVTETGWVAAEATAAPTGGSRVVVAIDPAYFRPAEVEELQGDATKALALLGWRAKTHFADLVAEMVRADLALVDRGDLQS